LLDWTGERFVPWAKDGQVRYEHLHRYYLAQNFVKGKNVLDLACGEGYGSFMLAKQAKSVVGIDNDEKTINHAKEKYVLQKNLKFIQTSMLDLQLDQKFDSIICFEALEHVKEHDKLFSEIKNHLSPKGILVISTPNKTIYSYNEKGEPLEPNPFHAKELDLGELRTLIEKYFKKQIILGQKVYSGSFIWNYRDILSKNFVYLKKENEQDIISEKKIPEPMYFIALCSDYSIKSDYRIHNMLDLDDEILNDVYNELRGPRYTKNIEKLQSEIQNTLSELKEKDTTLTQKIFELKQKITELKEKDTELTQQINENNSLHQKHQKLEVLNLELEKRKAENEALINQLTWDLNAIRNSKTWKMLQNYAKFRKLFTGS